MIFFISKGKGKIREKVVFFINNLLHGDRLQKTRSSKN